MKSQRAPRPVHRRFPLSKQSKRSRAALIQPGHIDFQGSPDLAFLPHSLSARMCEAEAAQGVKQALLLSQPSARRSRQSRKQTHEIQCSGHGLGHSALHTCDRGRKKTELRRDAFNINIGKCHPFKTPKFPTQGLK